MQGSDSIAVLNSSGKLVMECTIETKAIAISEFFKGLRGSLHVTVGFRLYHRRQNLRYVFTLECWASAKQLIQHATECPDVTPLVHSGGTFVVSMAGESKDA